MSEMGIKYEDVEKLNQKLERNRESARNSRKRKKIYVELLEQKVNHLTQELNATRRQLELTKNNSTESSGQNRMLNNLN